MRSVQVENLDLFDALSAVEKEQLKSAVRTVNYARGESIFRSGDPARYFYVVLSGRMKIYFLQQDGREQILYIYGAGEFIGGLNALKDTAFIYNAQALEETTIGLLDRQYFSDLVERYEPVHIGLMEQLWSRLRWAEALIGRLSISEAERRVARLLLDLIPHYGAQTARGMWLALTITQDEMGGLTGLSRETVTRQLKRLSEEQLIRMERGKGILIPDIEALERFQRV